MTRSQHILTVATLLVAAGCAKQPPQSAGPAPTSAAPTPAAPVEPMVDRLLRQIDDIPFADGHTHLKLPGVIRRLFAREGFHYDLPYALGDTTYVSRVTPGRDWAHVRVGVAESAQNAYYRPFVLAMRDLYGLGAGQELDDDSAAAISLRMDRAHRDPDWYGEVLRRANVTHILWMDYQGQDDHKRPENALKSTAIHPVWNIDDTLVYITGKYPPPASKGAAAGDKLTLIEARQGVKLAGLDDMDAMIERSIAKFFADGGVSLKTTSAYRRSLSFDIDVPRDKAAAVFARVVRREEPDADEQRLLEDYLMTKVLESADRHAVPFQFHTGNQQLQNIIENSNPLLLNRMIQSGRFPHVKFVLLHGGYPYTQEAVMLATYYPANVYLELAWMALFSPAAAKQTLSQALDMLHGSRVMMGTDAVNLEEMYGTVKITRRLLAEVLAEKVQSGLWSEAVAMGVARRVLYANAVELYGLETPRVVP